MNHNVEYDPSTDPNTPAHQVRTPSHQRISDPARKVLGTVFAVAVLVGLAGAVATFFNMRSAIGSGWMALGIVAVGEGATAVLGLMLVGLTLISRPYPAGMRIGLWLIPAVGSVTGAVVALTKDKPDYQHAMVNMVTPLAMTVAAEMAGYLARSIVVSSTGIDAEADRQTGETLRRIEWHQARAQHHPNERTRKRSAKAAWKLAKDLGRNDTRLGQQLPAAYADRTTTTALTALDALYHRAPAQQPAELPAPAPAPAAPAAIEPPTTPTAEQPPAVEADPGIYTETPPEVEEDQAVEPVQPQLPDRWLQSVPDGVRTEVHTHVHTGSDQQEDADDEDDDAGDEAARAARDQMIIRAAAEGTSQREIARQAGCSATTVRNVLARHAAAQEVA
ncbi:helix-turn-helix domain-containing protein [Kitasatospora sp. NPDC048298]|uniref:helix-turn-helix domain-containing protein n=1 Tax=Kitasatospora sp. NPDC048298 TaxID=3364049 RepID=UPI00371CF53B